MQDISTLSDIQSESGIIGTLIENPEYVLYSDQLEARHFFKILNGCLFWAISELYKSNITNIDSYNLINVINTNKAVQRELGDEITPENLNDFIRLSKNVARNTIEEYSKLVKNVLNNAFKRKLVESLEYATRACFNENDGIELFKGIQKKLDSITTDYIDSEIQPYSKLVRPLWEETRRALDDGGTIGYKPLISELEHYFTYSLGELVMYVGKRKVGKSIFAMNEAINLLKQGAGVLYVDTELSDKLFNLRLISYLAKIPFKRVQSGDYDDDSYKRIIKAISWVEKQNFFHLHTPTYDKERIYLIAKKLKLKNKLNFIVFDHFKSTKSGDSSTAYYELGNKCNFLKDTICGELGYGGICLAQQNRAGDIGESFRLEQEVSTVVYINPKSQDEIMNDGEDCGNRKLHVKANRLGDQMEEDDDYVDLGFKGYLCEFYNVDQHRKRPDTPF